MRDLPWWAYFLIAWVFAVTAVVSVVFGPKGASGDGLVVLAVPAVICAFRAGQLRPARSRERTTAR